MREISRHLFTGYDAFEMLRHIPTDCLCPQGQAEKGEEREQQKQWEKQDETWAVRESRIRKQEGPEFYCPRPEFRALLTLLLWYSCCVVFLWITVTLTSAPWAG